MREALINFYTEDRDNQALRRVFEIATGHGLVSLVIEPRYIDIDWRAEHSAFYSTTFVRYPSVCHRVHFFSRKVEDIGDLSGLENAYCGYTVLRPLASAPVGRTMVLPPQELSEAVQCFATETVDVLGWPMPITTVPFVSQDGQYLRCAHAAMWMVLQHAHLRRGHTRWTPKDIHDAVMGGHITGRQVPSDGPTVSQVLGGMTTLGLSPGLFKLPSTKESSEAEAKPTGPNTADLSLFGIVARYVNSNLPPIVISDTSRHAWLIVGYSRLPSAGNPKLTLYRHDDGHGPFLPVDNPWEEPDQRHVNWTTAVPPLPTKIYMSAERAEAMGRWWFDTHLDAGASGAFLDAHESGQLTFMTYGILSRDYKHGLRHRPSIDDRLAHARTASLSGLATCGLSRRWIGGFAQQANLAWWAR